MKLEEGKKYVDRRGRVFGPMILDGIHLFAEDKSGPVWHNDGRHFVARECSLDLIAEHVEICPMCENPCVPCGVACKECGEFAVEYAGCNWKGSENGWVTQALVPVRVGIDEFTYVDDDGKQVQEWKVAREGDNWDLGFKHGDCHEDGDTVHVRCRRKDLPASAAPPASKRTPVTLWVPEGGDWPVRVSFTGEKPKGIGSWVKVCVGTDGFFVEGGV
jgi:hypothetical protein